MMPETSTLIPGKLYKTTKPIGFGRNYIEKNTVFMFLNVGYYNGDILTKLLVGTKIICIWDARNNFIYERCKQIL